EVIATAVPLASPGVDLHRHRAAAHAEIKRTFIRFVKTSAAASRQDPGAQEGQGRRAELAMHSGGSSTGVADHYLETVREVPQVARPADLVIQVDRRRGAKFPGRLDDYHEVEHFLSTRGPDDRTRDVLPHPGRSWVPFPEPGDRAVCLCHPGRYQAQMPGSDQRDPVDCGRSAGIVKLLKAVIHDPAWRRPGADRR